MSNIDLVLLGLIKQKSQSAYDIKKMPENSHGCSEQFPRTLPLSDLARIPSHPPPGSWL